MNEQTARTLARLEGPQLDLHALARAADSEVWPPEPRFPPFPPPVYIVNDEHREPKEPPRPHRRKTMAERNRRIGEACANVAPQACVDHFDTAVGKLLNMTANGVKAARRRLGIAAKVLPREGMVA